MATVQGSAPTRWELSKIILASSLGTLIEWYDFYLFGALSTIIAANFFPKENDFAAFLSTLAIFAAGFVVRPFGAIVFGRLGDLAGRKVTFLMTLMIMGLSTFAIGLIPTYAQVGILAPILMLILRLIQGLALGGEYGGAATYVAEHSPSDKRGLYTSFLQTTATLGLFVALGVIQFTRSSVGEEAFKANGWRYPFLLSLVLVIFSYFIRRKMHESPAFTRAKEHGKLSKNPLVESFVNPANRKLVILALLGATAGQGVVWYTGQFYALSFMVKTLHIAEPIANSIVMKALLIGTPFFVVVGWLSDRIGRKKLILAGCLLAALCYMPLYQRMAATVDTSERPETASTTKRDKATGIGTRVIQFEDGSVRTEIYDVDKSNPAYGKIGLPPTKMTVKVEPTPADQKMLTLLVLVQVLFVTLVYGPIAAFLVELFPTHIRYTSMSLPYHLGNGVFGGLVPFIATALVGQNGPDPYRGLWYPIGIAMLTFVIGSIFLKEPNKEVFDQD